MLTYTMEYFDDVDDYGEPIYDYKNPIRDDVDPKTIRLCRQFETKEEAKRFIENKLTRHIFGSFTLYELKENPIFIEVEETYRVTTDMSNE